jgi:hypothetical protein
MKKFVVMAIIFAAAVVFAGNPRPFVFHFIDRDTGHQLTVDQMKLIQFRAYTYSNPADILTENSVDCGFLMCDTLSCAQVNIGNFDVAWQPGDVFRFELINFDDMQGYEYQFVLDNSSDPVFIGFEPFEPGSGLPIEISMSACNPLTGVDVLVSEESGNIILNWGFPGPGITGYNIYSSNEPYGTFSYIDTTTSISWSTAATENKKFFYVVSTNAKSSTLPSTVEVIKK